MDKRTESMMDTNNQFATIWNHVECGIAVIDIETQTIVNVNPVAARMFGSAEEVMAGKPCREVFCPVDLCPIIEGNQEIDRSERTFIMANGVALPIIKSVSKIEYNGRPALLESFIDLSPLKALAAEEEKARLQQVTKHLNQAKKKFLSQISHEMRTPMNIIHGMMQIAKNSNDINELRYCLDKISDAGERLFEFINDFFDMAKIEAGKFELEHSSINIEKMLINVCNMMKDKIEEKNIKIPIILGKDIGMNYFGDERRLAQIIICLLSNAVKFTPVNGKIRIMVEEVQGDGRYSVLRFSVKDNGIGMTEEQIERIWDAFEQADSDTFNRYGGIGLGLPLARNIVDKMDGTIWARSMINRGSTFYFEVRLKRSEQQDGAVIAGNIHPADIKILVADGDKEAREHLASILSNFGMQVDEAETTEKVDSLVKLAKAAGSPYDIIFSDYGLSNLDGIDAVKRTSSLLDNNTFIVLVTPSLRRKRIERYARSIGVGMFISKPLFPSVVLDTINKIISDSVKQFDIVAEHTNILPDLSDVTLLVAEDAEVNREILISQLKETKIKMDYVENGQMALEKFLQNPDRYDMILTDIQMPEMDGYELTRTIRSLNSDKAKSIPIIALTAEVFKEAIDGYIASGMDDYLAKPVNINVLCDKIQQYKSN